ncbi:tRNA (adenosine(37)-N6)-dimethylallyltransferase MiaA [Puniceibacterium sediminis]|uniref:tRNA dimethylallyltransferase n=1 Tax=Puniceibacterium sediminis TaxID=1608407 RepID=A0A238W2C0_9RHOB|nr:tRNA (adenosine(37)-N6)-dimethylallyltransferase MiaA [Puniceibacterium sediminis]SNR39859.1 tRNA dimethylallyltransferase [Puniceibacterium sediminis]
MTAPATFDLSQLDPDRPVLIAGATASGKSALALRIAREQGGVIVNADALQVYDNWRILSARPSAADEIQAPHALYGHVDGNTPYSVGAWLREVAPLLHTSQRPIITGGTGLYFSALTEGLADIPATPPDLRARADAFLRDSGLDAMRADLDAETLSRIDIRNPMRVQRAWEVQTLTGRGISAWQDDTPPPLLPLNQTQAFVVDLPKDILNTRIANRFAQMIDQGALDEARANLPGYDPAQPSAKAIGAGELIAHLKGDLPLDQAIERATIATRQFAKRQRTWFRARMSTWNKITPDRLSA